MRGREGAAAPEGTVRPTQRCPPHPASPQSCCRRGREAGGVTASAGMQRRSPGSRAAEILGRDTCAESPAEACAARTPFVLPTQVWPGDFSRP